MSEEAAAGIGGAFTCRFYEHPLGCSSEKGTSHSALRGHEDAIRLLTRQHVPCFLNYTFNDSVLLREAVLFSSYVHIDRNKIEGNAFGTEGTIEIAMISVSSCLHEIYTR